MAYLDYTLKDLPQDVRELALSAVRTLASGGPRGLIEAGLCSPDAEEGLVDHMSPYTGKLIELPDSAELYYYIRDGIWEIEIPLHDDKEGELDLYIYMNVDPQAHTVKVTDLYTP